LKDGFIKIAAASPDLRVGDCDFNAECIKETIKAAAESRIALLVLPELSLTGYTCGDLFFQKKLADYAKGKLLEIAADSPYSVLTAVGLPLEKDGKLYNCAALLYNGIVLGVVPKKNIPDYCEFYESRWFTPAPEENGTIDIGGNATAFGTDLLFRCNEMPEFCVAAEICEDLWVPQPPSVSHATAGANIIVNLSASDETIAKADYRHTLVCGQSSRLVCGYVYADAGWGESTTDMVFGGHDIIAENGKIISECAPFSAGFCSGVIDLQMLASERAKLTTYPAADPFGYETIPFSMELSETRIERSVLQHPFVPEQTGERNRRAESILAIQANGLRKRIEHTRAKKAVVGISGGLDSCLALLVAVRAMDITGRTHKDVLAVTMPCFGTTERTKSNAERLCECLGVELREIDITKTVKAHFKDIGQSEKKFDVTYENAQARERTQVLMDVANKENGLVVGTGDLSELALGWATYNGDHMSMYGVNAGVPKTLVRHIVKYAADSSDDPKLTKVLLDILATPVSPELLPAKDGDISQKTEDLVGPYELHDFFLYYMVRFGFTPSKIYRLAKHAFDNDYSEAVILKWLRNFYTRFFAQQFKRSCLPDGPKVGSVTLSPRGDWRMPSDACADIWLKEVSELEAEYKVRSSRKTLTYDEAKKVRYAKIQARAQEKLDAIKIKHKNKTEEKK
jgi:NAD+ synthase (glutamine-hydrolysing)